MLTESELMALMADLESDRVERTVSENDMEKFCIAVCCFSNDFPHHRKPGYLLVGVTEKGKASGLRVTDKLLRTLGEIRANGNVQPLPAILVYKLSLSAGAGDVAVVEVLPSDLPPVWFKGQVWIRVGPRRQIASDTEEKILVERRTASAKTFDAQPCVGSSLGDLSTDLFLNSYRNQAFAPEVIANNHRDIKHQLASLRFFDLAKDCPTHAGILLFGKDPRYWLPGAYVQFVRYEGEQLGTAVILAKELHGDLVTVLRELDVLLTVQLQTRPQGATLLTEHTVSDYPGPAIRELLLNAVMHRAYDSTAPIRFYWFRDRIEIQNPGSLYGEANAQNFPRQNAYRNPVIAEVLKNLGYVNRFGQGIMRVEQALAKGGNPSAQFSFESTYFLVTIKTRP
jgi:ATP-dependent DNA helicase RecG